MAPCPAFRARVRSPRDHARAGAVPESRPAAADRPAVNASTTPSRATSARRGMLLGIRAGAARTIAAATAQPTTPPATLRSTLSVSNCRTTRPRPAPSAPRMASSRRRAMPRARSRPATLAQASSSTSPVAAASMASAGRNGRPSLFPQADHSALGCRTQLRPGSIGPLAVDDRPHRGLRLVRRHAGPQAADSHHEFRGSRAPRRATARRARRPAASRTRARSGAARSPRAAPRPRCADGCRYRRWRRPRRGPSRTGSSTRRGSTARPGSRPPPRRPR